MPFNHQKYIDTEHKPRTAVVSVPALAGYFDSGEKPEWTVRNLTASELAKAREAPARGKNINALAEALIAGSKADKVKEFKDSLGYSEDDPDSIIVQKELLVLGSVEPVCPLELSVILSERHPETFTVLVNKIMSLSGMGAEEVKKKPVNSGETQKSEPVSP